jgi:hypothetical protein
MMRAILSVFAAAALLTAAASTHALGQTYNPYITVDAPELSMKRTKRTTTGAQQTGRKFTGLRRPPRAPAKEDLRVIMDGVKAINR